MPADDIAQLIALTCNGNDSLRKRGFVGIGASMGCSELFHAVLRHKDVAATCGDLGWLGPALPSPFASDKYPTAPSRELWESILDGFRGDRQGFVRAALPGLFGAHIGVEVSSTDLAHIENYVEQADSFVLERYIQVLRGKDFSNELIELGASTKMPVLVIWDKADKNIPPEAGAGGDQGAPASRSGQDVRRCCSW